MSAFVTLSGLGFRTPDGRALFENIDLALGSERTGLVGRNGAGKTTLLKLIAGELAPSEGAVARSGRLGVLAQNLQPPPDAAVADLLGVAADLARLARIAAGEGDEDDLAEADWTLEARLEQALAEVGLPGLGLARPAASLSGGEATRVSLARLLVAAPDLILLDEPTNNLDAGARALVAEILRGWRGGAVVVSHDRALLREMDRIVELSSLGARVYGGGYNLYAERRAEERASAVRELDAAERRARQVDREVQAAYERKDRRDAMGRRFAAKGSEPRLMLGAAAERAENSAGRASQLAERQRAEAAEALAQARGKVERLKPIAVDLPSSGLAAGKRVLAFDEVSFAWPGAAPLLTGLSFDMVGPRRLAVTGRNGAGKTTLIKLAVGDLAPTSGTVARGVGTALLDQRTAILDEAGTVLDSFRQLNPADSENACRAALARLLFRNDAALKPVGQLSGGERLRAALACVLGGSSPPGLLILDEPTNHLDLDSIAAIEAGLAGYDGALLVVSHDRDFLENIGVEGEIEL
jgi:ATPase subunit of ABC transporter with duplicated ATPase domains